MRQKSPHSCAFYRTGLMVFCIVVLLIFTLACQAIDQTTPVAQTTTSTSPASTAANAETSSATNNTTATTGETSHNEPLPFNDTDLVITYQEQAYALLADATGLLQVLGEGYQYSEAESCVYDGMDKTFDYGNICVYTIPSETADLLDGIDVYDDSLTTARNISVGSSRENVLLAYGPQAGQESDMVYNISGDINQLGEPKLTFLMDGDLVEAISFYSGSNFQD